MHSLTTEDIASGAKQFANSTFGKWFMEECARKELELLKAAQNAQSHELKASYIDASAGVRWAMNLIESNKSLAENPEVLKKFAK